MNKISKSLIVLFLTLLLGSYFSIDFVQAHGDKLSLGVTQPCNIKSAGNSCIAELKITNNTGEILDGTAILDIDYQGICGNSFDGEGIDIWYDGQISKMQWNDDKFVFIGFSIVKGETQPKLKIETHPALCPGEYSFSLKLEGTAEEEYITPPVVPVVLGSRGGGLPRGLIITDESTEEIGEEKPVKEEEPAEEFEEFRPLENSDQEVVRGRTSTEAEEEPAIESEEPSFAKASEDKEEEEETIKGEETGLGWLFAAIGDLFRLENLWWLLLFLIIIIIVLYWLSRKKKRKE